MMPIATEHTLEQAADLLRESEFAGVAPFAVRYAPGNLTSYALAFSQVAYNELGEHGPFLVVAWLGHGAWAFRLGDSAPYPAYIAEKLRCYGSDAAAIHLLLARALEHNPACTLEAAGIAA